jgi:hypothetical protein
MKLPDGMKDDISDHQADRIGPFEKSTYQMEGTIKSVVHRKDGDYYLVVEGKSGSQAVVEVPDPELCKGSPLASQIASARKAIEERYHPTDEKKDVNDPVSISGVGFYGWRGKKGGGTTGNSARLMPGLGVQFKGAR